MTRRITIPLLAVVGLLILLAASPAALASRSQVAMFEEDIGVAGNVTGTLKTLQSLGVGVLRYSVHWNAVAPGPSPYGNIPPAGFSGSDPNSPGYDWSLLDQLVEQAPRYGITVDLSVTGPAPSWANGRGQAPGGPVGVWRPSTLQYGRFVSALGERYSGHFAPTPGGAALPAVTMWEIWNEPNFGPDLAPQAIDRSTVTVGATTYRGLLDAAWAALQQWHRHDTIVIGNLDARGQSGPPTRGAPQGYPGNYAPTKPLVFVRDLYCVDAAYRPLRGRAAALRGCPTTAAQTRAFRSAHPALFAAAGFGDHPYPLGASVPPTGSDSPDPDFALFSQLGRFARVLDRIQRTYHSRHRFAIYNNEYGYITNPPNHNPRYVSPALSAAYLNWAEYLSWLNPRVASTMQYLLRDPDPRHAPEYGGFASGLEFFRGAHKPGYDAYRLPIFLPVTNVRRRASVLIWGCARPAREFGNRRVAVQFQTRGRGRFRVLRTISVSSSRGYFEVRVRLPGAGAVRLAWSYPGGPAVYSRTVPVSVR